ncbi:Holliday junction branch migration DNA helicase RuvB [Candidatus Poribacteria bacterium]|nr:Holliday junction branch migration DNA helicase RuvB [Candidatus Poribacteria bacterium]
MTDRLVNGDQLAEDNGQDYTFRPRRLNEIIGQEGVRDQLAVFIGAARERGEPLDHVLLSGPRGLGKTTFAHVIAHELGSNIRTTVGPVLERLELSQLLTTMEKGDVLFIDEVHRVNIRAQEILYPAMEDFALDIVLGQGGPGARPVRLPLPRFTLIGATTKEGLLSGPLRDRFGVRLRLDYYAEESLRQIIARDARLMSVTLAPGGAEEIAGRSRGTPRVAKRLLRRIRDYAMVHGDGTITQEIARDTLETLGVDELGLDEMDRRILQCIVARDGIASLNTIASAVSEDERTVEDTYEPFLIQIGFLSRTSRGRSLTRRAYDYLGVAPSAEQDLLF